METREKGHMPETAIGLDPDFIRKLERLSVVPRKLFPGMLKGEKPSPRHGSSVEFADFRTYAPGDDFRHVDWNAYGRLERLFLKMFREEEDLHLYLLFDVSESMRYGEPTKLDVARQLAAALGYIGLSSLDRVAVAAFADRLVRRLRPTRGVKHVPRLMRFLTDAGEPGAGDQAMPTHLGDALREFAIRTINPGVVVVISDFLDPEGYEVALTSMLGCSFDVCCVQVLSPEEVAPEIAGDLRLVDAETGDMREITVTRALLASYRERMDKYCEDLKQFCVSRGIGYSRLLTDEPVEEFVLRKLRRTGMVR